MTTFSIRQAAVSVASLIPPRRVATLTTLAVWAVLAASLVYWVLQWPQARAVGSTTSTPVAVGDDAAAVPATAAMGRALGVASMAAERAAAPALSSRLSLVGVVRAGARDGAALMAVDGKSPRAVRVGGEVEPGLYLLALEPRLARLGPDPQGAESVVLELPKPKSP